MSTAQPVEVIEAKDAFSPKDVKEFLSLFLESANLYTYNDDQEIIQQRDDNPVYITVEVGENKQTDRRQLYMYDEHLKVVDGIILNPFTESVTLSPDKEWFYVSVINTTLSCATLKLLRNIHELVLDHSKEAATPTKKGARKVTESISNVEILSPMMSLITDKKMLEELDSILNSLSDPIDSFFNVVYNKNNMVAKVHCLLLEDDIEKIYTKIRKKTWENWRKMMNIIFGDIDKNYTIVAEVVGCPQFDATTKCIYELMKNAGKYYTLAGFSIDLDELKKHINRIPLYYQKTQWLKQAIKASKIKQEPAIPTASPNMPQPQQVPQVPVYNVSTAPVLNTVVPVVPVNNVVQQPAQVQQPQSNVGMTGLPKLPQLHPNQMATQYNQPQGVPYPSQVGLNMPQSCANIGHQPNYGTYNQMPQPPIGYYQQPMGYGQPQVNAQGVPVYSLR